MLGTNDANLGVTPEKYLDNMSKIIDLYKEKAGIEKVIINQIPYAVKHDDNLTAAYNAGIYSLADGQSVFIGDTSIYDYTKANKDTIFSDSAGVHLTKDGYDKLGQLWAEAYKRVIIEPDSTNRNVVIDNKSNTVSYMVNKDKSWFAPATGKYSNLLVDGQILDATDYTVTGDSSNTTINLAANYVAKLVDGEHDIAIRYNDGVNFTDKFTVKHKVSDTNEKNDTNNNSSNNNVDTDGKVNQHVVPTAPNTGA